MEELPPKKGSEQFPLQKLTEGGKQVTKFERKKGMSIVDSFCGRESEANIKSVPRTMVLFMILRGAQRCFSCEIPDKQA